MSVKVAWYVAARRTLTISRHVFWPAPNVDSALVVDNYSSKYDLFERYTIDTFLKTIPDTAKSSILELMEYYFINTIVYFARHEIRDMMPYLTENESNLNSSVSV